MTIGQKVRVRKEGLRRLQRASLSLDAAQEKVEREVKRLLNRKKSIPEAADMERVLALIAQTSGALDAMSSIARDNLNSYGQ
jgi:hypothetical protein